MDPHVAIASRLPSERADELKKPSAWTQPMATALLALLAILMHLVLRYVYEFPRIICQGPLMVALVAGGVPLIFRLI